MSTRGRLVSQSTPTLRHSTNKTPHSDVPTTVQRDKRSKVANVPRQLAPRHTVRQQHYFVVLCNAVVVPRSHSCVGVCCCYPRPDLWCSPQRDKHPALSPFSQTSLANYCLSESVDESPPASSTTQLIILLPTQPV